MTQSVDVLGYLISKSLNVKRAPGNEVHLPCFLCDEPEGKRGRLYVNVDPLAEIPGLFKCQLCGAQGALPTIKKHFGDYTREQEEKDDSYLRRAVLAEAALYYHEALSENTDALHWLKKDRGLLLTTIQSHQLGWADGHLYIHLRDMGFRTADILATGLVHEDRATGRLVDFLTNHITIPYIMSGNVVMIRGRDLAGGERKYVTPFGQKTRLYNSDAVWSADELTICEGEFDALVCEQIGLHAVAVPGANTWQDTWDGYFTDVRRAYIVFDNDDAGNKGSAKLAARLGTKARVVIMPEAGLGEPKNDPTELLAHKGWTAVQFTELLHAAGGGLLVTVEDAIRQHSELQGMTGLKFGYTTFDLLIEPGLLPGQVMIPLAKTGSGKALASYEPVLTPGGWVPIGNLAVGQSVYGRDGRAYPVRGVFPQGERELFRVSFSDDASLVCDGSHLWTCQTNNDRHHGRERTVTTSELSELLQHCPRVYVPTAVSPDLPPADLVVEPYLLGVLLGDASFGGTSVVLTTDDETVKMLDLPKGVEAVRFADSGPGVGEYRLSYRGRYQGDANPLRTALRALGLLGHRSEHKFIPRPYLEGSDAQRWALLQGLLDTDAYIDPRLGGIEYATSSAQLAADVQELIRSLGGTAVIKARTTSCLMAYRMQVSLPPGRCPFRLQRRATHWHRERRVTRRFVSIESVGTGDATCISVGSPDGLFVAKDYIVTHNTLWLLNAMQWIADRQPDAKFLLISLEQMRGDWWERARRIYRFFNIGASDADAMRFWRDRLLIVDRNRLTEEQLHACLDDFAYEMGQAPSLVMIDYLGYFAQGFKGERYERTGDAVMSLKAVAKERRLPIISPHQVSRMVLHGTKPTIDGARDSGVVEETADFVLLLWSPDTMYGKELKDRTGEFNLMIGKSRHGGVGHVERMFFAPLSLAIVPEGMALQAQWARNELIYQTRYKHNWEEALVRHEAGTKVDELDPKKVSAALWQRRQAAMKPLPHRLSVVRA